MINDNKDMTASLCVEQIDRLLKDAGIPGMMGGRHLTLSQRVEVLEIRWMWNDPGYVPDFS